MSSLVDFAEMELAAIDMGKDSDDMNRAMHDHIITMVKTFADEGHSGFSASYAVGLLSKLLAFEPLSPLTGEDSEWVDMSDMSPNPTWQNRRCSHVFKEADGRAYDIEGRIFRDPDGSTWTSGDSRIYITFPYTPTREYVDRNETEPSKPIEPAKYKEGDNSNE